MTQAQAKLKALAKSHPVPEEGKLSSRIERLTRMKKFYEVRKDAAPEAQQLMFGSFIKALAYAINIVKLYASLTKGLAEVAKEQEDENIT